METVETLINDVRRGQILLPEFQRGYVWNSGQVRELVRSIYKGHPTGHFLMWKTYKPAPVRGGVAASSDGYSMLLLDGQQRLTSLYTLFEGKAPPFYEGEHLFFNLYFNIQTEEFRFWQKNLMDGDPSWINVHEFLRDGAFAFLQRLPKMDETAREIYERHYGRLGKLDAIRNYSYQVDRLDDEKLEITEVVDIFNRVNSGGTQLTKADLALAHVCSIWPEAREQFRFFSKQMRDEGFGVGLDFLIRCVAAVGSGSVLLTGSFFRVPAENHQAAWRDVKASFEYLVNVLKHDAYIDRVGDLPTPNVLLPLVVYLARNGSTFSEERQKRSFLRWMFLAGLWARYSGSTETKLQRDVALLNDPDPVDGLVDTILAERGRLRLEAKDLERVGGGSPAYKMSYVVARANEARDWFTGLVLYRKAVGSSNGLESHHIFPQHVLYRNGYSSGSDRTTVNQVANRAFLTQKANRTISAQAPEQYLPAVEENFPGALRAQAVPRDPELWKVENYEAFVAARRQLLADQINAFLDGYLLDQLEVEANGDRGARWLIEQGEHGGLEFKSSLRWDVRQNNQNKDLEKVIAKTVAGFLNSKDGGILLIGVADNREVLGLEEDYGTLRKPDRADRDVFEQHLVQVLMKYLGEAIAGHITITFHDIEGSDVCQVTVEAADHPIYLQDKVESTLYVRAGNSTRPLPVHEAVKYVSSRWP
jgi:hypothetical protein